MTNFQPSRILFFTAWLILLVPSIYSQSTEQNYPTPVTTNEINGEIKARDIGDARLTTYFYTFNGSQGDIFVNIVAKNLNGSFDIFTADNLLPLTKILVYADSSDSETGRVIYLRKPEKLILRVEGRSPNDDPARYILKFAGGFVAAEDTGYEAPEMPEVKTSDKSRTRVNSVGTVIERIPKRKPLPPPTIAAKSGEKTTEVPASDAANVQKERPPGEVAKAAEKQADDETAKKDEKPADDPAAKKDEPKADAAATQPGNGQTKVEVVVTDNIPKSETEASSTTKAPVSRSRARKTPAAKEPAKKAAKPGAETGVSTESKEPAETGGRNNADNSVRTLVPSRRKKTTVAERSKEPNPLENIHLVIELKDGTKIEKQMSDVLRFTVDRGVLTVITRDGKISRFQILDVLRTTIQ